MKIKFRWYDLWVGVYYDKEKRRIHICPFPCIIFEFDLKPKNSVCEECGAFFMGGYQFHSGSFSHLYDKQQKKKRR